MSSRKIYIVMEHIPYEGDEIIAVFEDSVKAKNLATKRHAEETYTSFAVHEWEITE
jgi:hypothetical protein